MLSTYLRTGFLSMDSLSSALLVRLSEIGGGWGLFSKSEQEKEELKLSFGLKTRAKLEDPPALGPADA